MSVRPLVAPVAALSFVVGALALPQFVSAQEASLERGAIVVKSNNRSSIVIVPWGGARQAGRVSERADDENGRRGGASSSVTVETVPVNADMVPSMAKEKGDER